MSDLTPVDIEARLLGLIKDAYEARKTLKEAREAETSAEVAYKRAKARAFHHHECPHVARGVATVADRDAWVDEHVMDEWIAYRIATTAREVAQDNLRVVFAVMETERSLNASVRQAYSVAGAA